MAALRRVRAIPLIPVGRSGSLNVVERVGGQEVNTRAPRAHDIDLRDGKLYRERKHLRVLASFRDRMRQSCNGLRELRRAQCGVR